MPSAMAGAPDRLQHAFLEEERKGIGWAATGRLIALFVIAIWVAIENTFPEAFYFLGLLLAFAAIGVLLLAVSRSQRYRPWMKYGFVAADAALLAFTLLVPSPLRDFDYDIQLQLRFGNFPYFFVILLGAAALAQSAWFAVWSGVVCAAAWATGVGLIALRPDTVTLADLPADASAAEILAVLLDPKFVLTNQLVTQVLTLLIVAGILATAAYRNRLLVAAQAGAERGRANLARYFSPNLVEELAGQDEPLGAVREQNAAVLFADIVGFTTISADKPPATVIGLLREVHARLTQVVFAHDGTLDKFIGDGVMATFGTPQARADDALRALRCAKAMQASLADWNTARQAQGEPPVRIGIGLHYGPVVLGDIGDRNRLEFAVIGDTVNVASRLERLTRELDVDLVVSADVVRHAEGVADGADVAGLQPHAPVTLRGRDARDIGIRTWRVAR